MSSILTAASVEKQQIEIASSKCTPRCRISSSLRPRYATTNLNGDIVEVSRTLRWRSFGSVSWNACCICQLWSCLWILQQKSAKSTEFPVLQFHEFDVSGNNPAVPKELWKLFGIKRPATVGENVLILNHSVKSWGTNLCGLDKRFGKFLQQQSTHLVRFTTFWSVVE